MATEQAALGDVHAYVLPESLGIELGHTDGSPAVSEAPMLPPQGAAQMPMAVSVPLSDALAIGSQDHSDGAATLTAPVDVDRIPSPAVPAESIAAPCGQRELAPGSMSALEAPSMKSICGSSDFEAPASEAAASPAGSQPGSTSPAIETPASGAVAIQTPTELGASSGWDVASQTSPDTIHQTSSASDQEGHGAGSEAAETTAADLQSPSCILPADLGWDLGDANAPGPELEAYPAFSTAATASPRPVGTILAGAGDSVAGPETAWDHAHQGHLQLAAPSSADCACVSLPAPHANFDIIVSRPGSSSTLTALTSGRERLDADQQVSSVTHVHEAAPARIARAPPPGFGYPPAGHHTPHADQQICSFTDEANPSRGPRGPPPGFGYAPAAAAAHADDRHAQQAAFSLAHCAAPVNVDGAHAPRPPPATPGFGHAVAGGHEARVTWDRAVGGAQQKQAPLGRQQTGLRLPAADSWRIACHDASVHPAAQAPCRIWTATGSTALPAAPADLHSCPAPASTQLLQSQHMALQALPQISTVSPMLKCSSFKFQKYIWKCFCETNVMALPMGQC